MINYLLHRRLRPEEASSYEGHTVQADGGTTDPDAILVSNI